jgi:hypothetical protein
MIKNFSIIILISFLIGCESIDSPPNNNILDPDSPNYIGVLPTNLRITSLTERSVRVYWDYSSSNYRLFKVELSSNSGNEKESLYSEFKFIDIANLDTSKIYTIKVQAMFEQIVTEFSEPISISFTPSSSFKIVAQKSFSSYGPVSHVTLSPEFNYAAVLNNELNILLPRQSFKFHTTITASASKFVFSYNDDYLLIVNTNSQLEIWKTDTWSLHKVVDSMVVETCTSSLTNNTIAISNIEEVKILELPGGTILKSFPGYDNTSALRFSDDGQFLIIGNSANQVKIIECNNWNEIKSFTANGAILSVDISLDNRYLLYTFDVNLEIVDLSTDQIIRSYTSYYNNIIIQALFTTNPDIILLASGAKILQIYASVNLPERNLLYTLETIPNFCKEKSNYRFAYSGDLGKYFSLEFVPGGSWYQIVN